MEVVHLPAAQLASRLGAMLLRRRRIFLIGPEDMAFRVSRELTQLRIEGELPEQLTLPLDAAQLTDMERERRPVPLSVAVAALAVFDENMAALDACVADLRAQHQDPAWPYSGSVAG